MKSLLIKLNSDSYVLGPISLSSLQRITCKFVCLFFNLPNIAEVIVFANYGPNRKLIRKSFPCTSWLNVTCLHIKHRSIDKAGLIAAGCGCGRRWSDFNFLWNLLITLFSSSAGLHWEKACQLLMGIVLKFKKDTEKHKNTSVTLDDKLVWKMKELGKFQSKCCKDSGVRGVFIQMYKN